MQGWSRNTENFTFGNLICNTGSELRRIYESLCWALLNLRQSLKCWSLHVPCVTQNFFVNHQQSLIDYISVKEVWD